MVILNNKIFIIFLIIFELVLFLIMAFTARKKYGSYSKVCKILWRIILLIPIGSIIIPSVIMDPQRYKILLFVGLCIVIAADMAIIYNSLTGLFVFLIYHIINIINYSLLSQNNQIILHQWLLLFFLLFLWFIIFKLTFKTEEFKKFLIKSKVPGFLQHPIYAKILLFLYISSVLISCWCGFRLISNENIQILFPLLAFIGALIFAAGDYFIFYEILKRPDNPFHQILNNILYYIPLILYALLSVIRIS